MYRVRIIGSYGVDGKASKTAALTKFSVTLTLSQSGGAYYAHPLALSHLKNSVIMPLANSFLQHLLDKSKTNAET